MPKISDASFESALANEDNRRILKSISNKYRRYVSYEELKFRGYMALYHCLIKHDATHTTKFTSSLYRHMEWQCKKAVRDKKRHSPLPSFSLDVEPYYVETTETLYVRDCLSVLPKKYSQVLFDYYFEGMTLQEIGNTIGCTSPTVLRRLRKAEEEFRRLYSDE